MLPKGRFSLYFPGEFLHPGKWKSSPLMRGRRPLPSRPQDGPAGPDSAGKGVSPGHLPDPSPLRTRPPWQGCCGANPPCLPAHSDRMQLLFLLSSVAKNEVVLSAELHLFKLRSGGAEGAALQRQHYCQVSIYQVLDKDHPEAPQGKKLLSARLLALQGFGWEVFPITQAVRDWVAEESRNQGLLVTVQGLGGAPLDPHTVHFASGRDHHASKKPMLVLFTDDGRRAAALPSSFPASPKKDPSTAPAAPPSAERPLPCQRYPLPWTFDEIRLDGLDHLTARPTTPNTAKGACRFPLARAMRPTNTATPEVHTPCCVPTSSSPQPVYFDDDETDGGAGHPCHRLLVEEKKRRARQSD
uniref:TGF-beta family profile domain-containing protein n=1 Tax=Laticauda laticaudata TaxID=8630 RepID=A0A8C5SZX3_LATLA